MAIEFGLHFLGEGRALFFLGFFQSKTRAVLGGFFVLRLAGEGLSGFAEFYDIVFRHEAYRGFIINSGRTTLSNSFSVTKPSLTASSRKVVPFLCAVLATFVALS